MTAFEYQVIPAPAKGVKVKGLKTPEDRFAHALQELMNRMGAEGWEYQRAETLPSTERAGLTGSVTHWRHVLIFRRALHARVEGPDADWPAPPTDFSPRPGEREEAAAPPPEDSRPPRPTLVATRKDPADSNI